MFEYVCYCVECIEVFLFNVILGCICDVIVFSKIFCLVMLDYVFDYKLRKWYGCVDFVD